MPSFKTVTHTLIIASFASSALAAPTPGQGATHEARLSFKLPSAETTNLIKAAGLSGLIGGGLGAIGTEINKLIQGKQKSRSLSFDEQDFEARAINPEIVNLAKTAAVGGLVSGGAGAILNKVVSLIEGNKQSRAIEDLTIDDVALLTALSRRAIENLD
ncbi:hypothetical protein B0F90DRAFT_1815196 [Multifurca ochricompacta]|uniref:Uncharacterized protein n=1 Tax=Multifurca ochricompacta TaxID=376703 RepID=A0AAD4QQX3_9AGAM|nr:hypothetical protein B0F90DRAFT_1815196 [Multifurca ochricompacta]